jgi:hypothetical protein
MSVRALRRPGAAAPALLLLATGLGAMGTPTAARAQGADAATIAELRQQLNDMRRRMEQLEALVARQARAPSPAPARAARAPAAPVQADVQAAQAAAREARAAADQAQSIQQDLARAALPAAAGGTAPTERDVAGLQPPEPMGDQTSTGDALRSDLPGIAFRVPGTETQVRLYGFAKLSAWTDANGRNQTDAPLPGGIPLSGSPAAQQGGDFGMTARFSRFGVDTRSLTAWGTLETRLEGDFGGGSPTSSNAVFRLRQAWGELGDERLRVLVGQANSLWNEGVYETLIDATNLNQSFIRQAQLRLTARLAPGLTGQVSIEAPETQYTAAAGVFTPGSTLDGGASPAFNNAPDLLARLNYRKDGLEIGLRGMLRQLQIRPAGTAAAQPFSGTTSATGVGGAAHMRFPMRWLSESLGADEFLAMAYVGEGMGRYFAGSTNGQDALSNIGMPGLTGRVSLDPVPAWGVTAGYRRFWTPQIRTNLSYSFSRQDFPSYALAFAPGSAAATSLNRDVQQVFANIIWSPFGQVRNGVFGSGWLDIGFEYLYTRRDLYGGAAAAGTGQAGHGIANRFLFATVARF